MLLSALLACTPADLSPADDPFDPSTLDFPAVADLPLADSPPDLLQMWSSGEVIDTVERWQSHRVPEARLLFAHYVYGDVPTAGPTTQTNRTDVVLPGVVLTQIDAEHAGRSFVVSLFHRPESLDQPVLLGLNKCGEHTLLDDPLVPIVATPWEQGCDPARGSRSSYWAIEEALSAGFAVATVHQSAFALDEPDQPLVWQDVSGSDAATLWGAIGIWSYGLSRTLDVLSDLPEVDPDRVVVWGHSRRGKAALWAGAVDERFAMVWAHQSGTAGQTLSRSHNGEPVGAMNLLFPHWFPPNFHSFGEREDHLPIDQHALLAMIAPRPLRLTDGTADAWADPTGVDWALELAQPVFDLYGVTPVHTLREGGHDVRTRDWISTLDDAVERL